MTAAETHPQLSPAACSGPVAAGPAEATAFTVQVAELAAIREAIADMKKSRSTDAAMDKSFADLNAKFDSMKDNFAILEAHISVGLAKSIADMMKTEVSTIEHQIVERYRYRTRYYLALVIVFALVAVIAIDQTHPFLDRVRNLFGY